MHHQLQITETSHEFSVPTVKWNHGWVQITVETTWLFQAFCEIALKSTQWFQKKKSAPLGNGLGMWMSSGRMHRNAHCIFGEAGGALGSTGSRGRDTQCCRRAGHWLCLGRWGSSRCAGLRCGDYLLAVPSTCPPSAACPPARPMDTLCHRHQRSGSCGGCRPQGLAGPGGMGRVPLAWQVTTGSIVRLSSFPPGPRVH